MIDVADWFIKMSTFKTFSYIKVTNVSCLYIKLQVLTKPEVIEQRFNFSLPSDYQAIFGQGTKKRGQITKIMSNYIKLSFKDHTHYVTLIINN